MYIEILLIGIVVFGILIYNGTISTSKFFGENRNKFQALQEKDYEFLLRVKYGERVYDVSQVFRKRVFNGLITILLINFIFITKMSALTLVGSIIFGYIMVQHM